MNGKGRKNRANRRVILAIIVVLFFGTFSLIVLCKLLQDSTIISNFEVGFAKTKKPEDLLKDYMSYIESENFDKMYEILAKESKAYISYDDFIIRNKNIYNGIEAKNISIDIYDIKQNSKKSIIVFYKTQIDSIAGKINFKNKATFIKEKENTSNETYRLIWHENLIFPDLEPAYKVKVIKQEAKRGVIIDRNGKELAGWTTASSVGIIPEKFKNKNIRILSKLLGISKKTIIKKLSQKWVKNDSFVPIKIIPKLLESERLLELDNEKIKQKTQLQQNLLEISGVMLTDIKVRNYPLGKAASHLTGYVQSVTAQDLEEHPDEGYSASSIIGRAGMEALYEKKLKGQDGYKIAITDQNGAIVTVLTETIKKDGQTIKLTIDAKLQEELYQKFKDDKSCSVAINPYTGEVLALVSTPSFDSNDFIYGMSEKLWMSLNNDEKKPFYNRFRQKLCPGSSFKPIIAAVGLETNVLNPYEDFGNEGLSWQKDKSWGGYYITTLHETTPANMKNALINSDNIYFAKLALRIGKQRLEKSLKHLGFNKKLPFEISVSESQYANNGSIGTQIQLADSGYGQGQILINPVHLASLYTGFVNGGDILKPYLRYNIKRSSKVWINQAFSKETADIVKECLISVISSYHGTGHTAYMEDISLAGKTGTAEIKNSKEDNSGTELGWFCVFTTDMNIKKPVLLLSMTEDVKGRGGSGYVVKKDKEILETYVSKTE